MQIVAIGLKAASQLNSSILRALYDKFVYLSEVLLGFIQGNRGRKNLAIPF
jgi:hypothetical protein